MPHTPHTLDLDHHWDITLNGVGHIALAGDVATAQNVANECRLFTNDAYFARDEGIPHFLVELGHTLPESLFRTYLAKAARKVPQVAEVQNVTIEDVDRQTRTLTGSVEFTTTEGSYVTLDI